MLMIIIREFNPIFKIFIELKHDLLIFLKDEEYIMYLSLKKGSKEIIFKKIQ